MPEPHNGYRDFLGATADLLCRVEGLRQLVRGAAAGDAAAASLW